MLYVPQAETLRCLDESLRTTDATKLRQSLIRSRDELLGSAGSQLQDHPWEADALCVCPISHELMRDPVICCDGQSYERESIEKWFEHHDTSPLTNVELRHKELIPNHLLRAMCDRQMSLSSTG